MRTGSDDYSGSMGMSVSDTARHNARKVVIEKYPILGHNHRLTDLQAAVGVEQMKRLVTSWRTFWVIA
jgi:dTDP-4-amino-4,6-dideoxygalactose transaminase